MRDKPLNGYAALVRFFLNDGVMLGRAEERAVQLSHYLDVNGARVFFAREVVWMLAKVGAFTFTVGLLVGWWLL
jgi:hypothetical protein